MRNNTTLGIAVAALLATATAGSAEAQPGAYDPPPPGAAPAPAPSRGWDGVQKFGVGLRLSSMGLTSTADEDNKTELGGGGLQVRYRLDRRWEFELSLEGLTSEQQNGMVKRKSSPVTLGVLVHMRPESQWDWYVVGGLGSTHDRVSYYARDGETETGAEEFQSGHVHLGIGVERRFRRFGISAEARVVHSKRNNDKLDGLNYDEGVDGPIPAESSGGTLSLAGTYYF